MLFASAISYTVTPFLVYLYVFFIRPPFASVISSSGVETLIAAALGVFLFFFWYSTGFHSGGGERGGLMKPLAAVATSFFATKLLFSSRRKSKSNHSQVEVSRFRSGGRVN